MTIISAGLVEKILKPGSIVTGGTVFGELVMRTAEHNDKHGTHEPYPTVDEVVDIMTARINNNTLVPATRDEWNNAGYPPFIGGVYRVVKKL